MNNIVLQNGNHQDNPLFYNNFIINGVNNNFAQKKIFEDMLINFNDYMTRDLINNFNNSNIKMYANTDLANILDNYNIKLVVTGGKAINYHLPLQYVDLNDPGLNPDLDINNHPKTNIKSFDYDLHIIIYDINANKAKSVNQIFRGHEYHINMDYDAFRVLNNDIRRSFLNNNINDNLGNPWSISNFLSNYFNNIFIGPGGIAQPLTFYFRIYLNNIFRLFNDHPDNIKNGSKIFEIQMYNMPPNDAIPGFAQHVSLVSEIVGIQRLAIPISYNLINNGVAQNYTKYFPFCDLEWDEDFKMLTGIGNVAPNLIDHFRDQVIPNGIPNSIINYMNNRLDDPGSDVIKIPMEQVELININNVLAIPLDMSLLNTIVMMHKKNYLKYKKEKNLHKYNKIIDKLQLNEEPKLNLNPRYWDISNINAGANRWKYITRGDIRISSILNGVLIGNDSNIIRRFLSWFNIYNQFNNIIHGINPNEYIFCHVNDEIFAPVYEDLSADPIILILNNINAGIQALFNQNFIDISNNVLLKDHGNNNILNNQFNANLPNLRQFVTDYVNDDLVPLGNANADIHNALISWIGNGYVKINYTLTCDTYNLNNILPQDEQDDIYEYINTLDNLFGNVNLRLPANQLLNINHPRFGLLQEPEIQHILGHFDNANWLLTYRVTRYFNIRNMIVADHNNCEFYKGQNFISSQYLSTSYSPYMNWQIFQNLEDPFYIFEYIINANDRNKYIVIDRYNGMSEKEIILNRNLNLLICKIDVKNIEIIDEPKKKIRNKFTITVLVLDDDQLADLQNMVEIQNLDNQWIDANQLGDFNNNNNNNNNNICNENVLHGGTIMTKKPKICTSSFGQLLSVIGSFQEKKSNIETGDKYKQKYLKYKKKYLDLLKNNK